MNSLKNSNHPTSHRTKKYTDDTAMARQIAISYIKNKSFNYKDLAERFSKEFLHEPWRGYGGSVVDVFHKLQEQNYADPFKPAAEQFNGSGSYGNGAGMRAHPVGLASYKLDLSQTIETAVNVGRITHAHVHGIGGGVLQTLAVKQALRQEDCVETMLKKIREGMEKFESTRNNKDYSNKLDLVEEFLKSSDTALDEICFELGNSVAAIDSVPTALYCFLKCCKDYEKKQQFEQTIRLAIRMGGDTDTIASMAGAISGAYLGIEDIPDFMIRHCEAVEDAYKQATGIHDIVTLQKPSDSEEKQTNGQEVVNNGDARGTSEPPEKKPKADE
eukprot:TRINITY_DN5960_c0_g1_i4.p1 TRINITY_DN5960_c0_g1~~TRINITY_DN5960_c0_g1_i4.p1  ORF type:complete len:330 (+),score=54.11 TRINITY_DN5960_c0_g1_i4:139-1128(+)